MGEIVLAAKITHVPSMYLSELPGEHHGCRQAAIDGHYELGRRARERGADTMLVFDTHWLVNGGYHVNCAPKWSGIYTSNELPHFIKDMEYSYRGNPELGEILAATATEHGVFTRAHQVESLALEYGTLVPNRYMNTDDHFKVVSVAAWCAWHQLEESRRFGEAVRIAIENSDSKVAVFASGSLSHHFSPNGSPPEAMHGITREFDRQIDVRVMQLWREGRFDIFTRMLPDYANHCFGEGGMHDTAMLLGMLGWDEYDKPVDVVTDYFGSSGTGQVNIEFPLPW
jgi:3,4-dihydroxyphenylacetate 2,3-dioxygenase